MAGGWPAGLGLLPHALTSRERARPSVRLRRRWLGDAGLAALARRPAAFQAPALGYSYGAPAAPADGPAGGLGEVRPGPELRETTLSECTDVTPGGLAALAGAPGLRRLRVVACSQVEWVGWAGGLVGWVGGRMAVEGGGRRGRGHGRRGGAVQGRHCVWGAGGRQVLAPPPLGPSLRGCEAPQAGLWPLQPCWYWRWHCLLHEGAGGTSGGGRRPATSAPTYPFLTLPLRPSRCTLHCCHRLHRRCLGAGGSAPR